MKKNITSLLTASLLLTGCGGTNGNTNDKVISMNLISTSLSGLSLQSEPLTVLFKADGEVPYLNLKDGAKLLDGLRKSAIGSSASCQHSIADNKVVFAVENDAGIPVDYEIPIASFYNREAINATLDKIKNN